MHYINISTYLLKNDKIYNFIFLNSERKLWLILNIYISYNLTFNYNLYSKLIKLFLIENGFKFILFET